MRPVQKLAIALGAAGTITLAGILLGLTLLGICTGLMWFGAR